MHPEARLNAQEKQQLIDGILNTINKPGKQLKNELGIPRSFFSCEED